ncbi:MAG: sigma-70 family RNA polymerase sigma factor [Betaproteobacteria bacterium]|nr:sigma-70 family RNA polymerase sigma factor [Betaproteobacteria bacterium]
MPTSPSSGRTARRTRGAAPAARTASTPKPLPTGEDDAQLVQLLAGMVRRDQAALAAFYDLTVSRVYSIAYRIVRVTEMAEEVVSDVYLQAWRDAARYDPARGRVLGWLLIMARTRALDALRRDDEAFAHPEPYSLVEEPACERDGPLDLIAATRRGTALHAAIQALPAVPRQLLALAFFRGLTHSEIVEATGLPLGTVKTHIRRALAALKDALGEEAAPNPATGKRR